MTISSTTRKAGPYTGNGVTTTFPFTFKVFTSADVLVVRTDLTGAESTLVLGTDYTISLNSDQNSNPGGNVVLVSALTASYLLTLTSQVAATQTTDLTNQGGFYPEVVTNALDKLTIVQQQALEQLSRAVKTDISSSITPEELLQQISDDVASTASDAASASASAASALALLNTFRSQYYGSASSDPSVDPLGNAPSDGDMYFNSSTQRIRIYGSATWTDAAVVTPMTLSTQTFSGTGTQTVFTLSTAPAYQNACEVFISGVAQIPGTDFTVTGSPLTTLTFTSAPPSGTNNIFVRSVSSYASGTPTDGSVTTAKLAGQSVTNAKLAFDAGAFTLRNKLTNGDLAVWQRATSFTVSASTLTYVADRWFLYSANANIAVSRSLDVPVDSGLPYSVKIQRPAASTDSNPILFGQVLESIDGISLSGKTVTLSFWIKRGANYTAGLMNPYLYFGNGSDQGAASMIAGTWSSASNSYGYEPASTSWVRQSTQFTVPSGTREIGIALSRNCSGTAGADDTLYFAGIQLEIGGEPATAFELIPYQVQLARCQRYYLSQNYISLNGDVIASFPVTMRTTPTVTTSAGTANSPNASCFRLNHSATATVTITASAEL